MNTPAAIKATIADLDAKGKLIDAAFQSCASLDQPTHDQWTAYYADYLKWSSKSQATLGATLNMIVFPSGYASSIDVVATDAANYEITMNRWADAANQKCGTHLADAPPAPPTTGLDYITGATYLALAVGGLYVLATFGPALSGLIPKGRARRR